MDLRDYLRILRRNWLLIVAFTLLGLLGGGLGNLLVTPTYTAETQLFVAIQNSGSVQELQQGNTFSQARVQSYVKTVSTPAVLQPTIDSLGLASTPEQLARQVSAESDLNTVLIRISVADKSPVQAAAVAQGVAASLIDVVESLEKPTTGGSSPVRLSVVAPAVAPTTPSAPNTKVNLALGVLLGLAAGVGTSLVRTLLDNRVRGEADVRAVSDAAILGRIAFEPSVTASPLLTHSASQGPRAESFRQLRTNLQFANAAGRAKTVVVTSSLPGEGKSTTAANLAIALSESGESVCLIDADLRRPMLDQYLGLERAAGLTTALLGQADVNDLLQPWGEKNLFVLTSGQIPPNPSELLGSQAMQELLQRLETVFDAIIIDVPPLLPVTDAAVLSRHADGVVLVVGSEKVKRQDLQKSIDVLTLVETNLMGVVLNRLPAKGPDAYTYGNYGYGNQTPQQNEPDRRAAEMIRSRKALSFARLSNPKDLAEDIPGHSREKAESPISPDMRGSSERRAATTFPRSER